MSTSHHAIVFTLSHLPRTTIRLCGVWGIKSKLPCFIRTATAAFRSLALKSLLFEGGGQRLQQTRLTEEIYKLDPLGSFATTKTTARIYETVAAGQVDDKSLDLRHVLFFTPSSLPVCC